MSNETKSSNGPKIEKPEREVLQIVFKEVPKMIEGVTYKRRCVEFRDANRNLTAVIYRKTRLFGPKAKERKEYVCDVWWRYFEKYGYWIGLAEPCDEYKLILPRDEWAGNGDLTNFYPRVMFWLDEKDGRSRLMFRDEDGKIGFPRTTEDERELMALLLPPDETCKKPHTPYVQVFIKEEFTVCKATYIPDVAVDKATGETVTAQMALTRIARKEGELSDVQLLGIELSVVKYKVGVQNSEDTNDLVSVPTTSMIYDMLHAVLLDQHRSMRHVKQATLRSSQDEIGEVFDAVAMKIAPDLHMKAEAEKKAAAQGDTKISAEVLDEIAAIEAAQIKRPLVTRVTRHNVYQALLCAKRQACEIRRRIDAGEITEARLKELEEVIVKYRTVVEEKKKKETAASPRKPLLNPALSPEAAKQLKAKAGAAATAAAANVPAEAPALPASKPVHKPKKSPPPLSTAASATPGVASPAPVAPAVQEASPPPAAEPVPLPPPSSSPSAAPAPATQREKEIAKGNITPAGARKSVISEGVSFTDEELAAHNRRRSEDAKLRTEAGRKKAEELVSQQKVTRAAAPTAPAAKPAPQKAKPAAVENPVNGTATLSQRLPLPTAK